MKFGQLWLSQLSKIYQKNIRSFFPLAQLFLDTLEVILQKKIKIIGKFFSPNLEMQFFSIFLKYQEIDVRIQTFTDQEWSIQCSCPFEYC